MVRTVLSDLTKSATMFVGGPLRPETPTSLGVTVRVFVSR